MSDMWDALGDNQIIEEVKVKKKVVEEKKAEVHEKIENLKSQEQTQETKIQIEKFEKVEEKMDEEVKNLEEAVVNVQNMHENLIFEKTQETELMLNYEDSKPKLIVKQYMISEVVANALEKYIESWKENLPGTKKGAIVELALANFIGIGIDEARKRAKLATREEKERLLAKKEGNEVSYNENNSSF